MTPIYKRGKNYWIDFYHQGKRRRQSLRTDRLLEAKDAARNIEDRIRRIGSGPILQAFAEQYQAWARTSKPRTAGLEEQRFKVILSFFEGHDVISMKDITPKAVEELRAHLLEDKKSKTTVNRYLQILRGMFYKAAEWGEFEGENPLRRVKFFREESPVRVPTVDEIRRIRCAVRWISLVPHSKHQAVFYDLVDFALNTGMRKSEILNLRQADIRDGEAHVRGKGDRVRKIPLNRIALDIIERQPGAGEYVFDVPNRKAPTCLHSSVLIAGRRASVRWHFHQLRHRFATDLLERGIDLVTVSQLLGHAAPTTSLIYSHSSAARKREAVDLLGGCDLKYRHRQSGSGGKS